MARTLVFLAEVESDMGEAYWWYEEKDLGLGGEFLRCLEEAFSRISDYPEQFGSSEILVKESLNGVMGIDQDSRWDRMTAA
jgi:hypothetical protein